MARRAQGGVTTNAVERAVAGMTIGTVRAFQARRAADWVDAMDERDEQFQIPVAGRVGSQIVWAEVTVEFAVNFFDVPERDSIYDTPLFTYGFEFLERNAPGGGRSKPVMATVHVKSWSRSGQSITGAKLLVGLVNPGRGQAVYFSGLLHANFQGFGAPQSNEIFDTEGEG